MYFYDRSYISPHRTCLFEVTKTNSLGQLIHNFSLVDKWCHSKVPLYSTPNYLRYLSLNSNILFIKKINI